MAKNKGFKDISAAAMFIATEPAQPTENTIDTLATTHTLATNDTSTTETNTNTEKTSKKIDRTGKRFNLSLYSMATLQDLKTLAGVQGISVNELINNILTDYTAAHAEELNYYKAFTKK